MARCVSRLPGRSSARKFLQNCKPGARPGCVRGEGDSGGCQIKPLLDSLALPVEAHPHKCQIADGMRVPMGIAYISFDLKSPMAQYDR